MNMRFLSHTIIWVLIGVLVVALQFPLFACSKSVLQEPSTTTLSSANGIIDANEYPNSVTYDNGNLQIYWKIEGQFLFIGIKAKTTGWVALGFNATSKLKDVDYVFGWVSNGKASVSDEYSEDYHGQHQTDVSLGGKVDLTEFGGQEDSSYTVIEFKRALVTGDAFDASISPGDLSIIWAYASSDNISTAHSRRGYGQIHI
jgi:hypothetical protein